MRDSLKQTKFSSNRTTAKVRVQYFHACFVKVLVYIKDSLARTVSRSFNGWTALPGAKVSQQRGQTCAIKDQEWGEFKRPAARQDSVARRDLAGRYTAPQRARLALLPESYWRRKTSVTLVPPKAKELLIAALSSGDW